MVSRLTILIAGFSLAYSFLVFHLYQLQLEKGDYYLARAAALNGAGLQYERRGSIYFTDKQGNGVPAVSNKDFPTVYAVPKTIVDAKGAAVSIAPLFGLDPALLEKKFANKDDSYELLGKKVSSELADQVDKLNIKGIYVNILPQRFYPFGTLAAHVLGYVGPSKSDLGFEGHYGVEEQYNEMLSGKDGEEGQSLALTIDPNIQLEAERILEKLVTEKKAKNGSLVVEDPKTGKILTMASFPNYDPNNYTLSNVSSYLNPVTQEIYEPGSVFKIITMAAGIDSGKITPNTTYTDTGSLVLNGKKIMNWDLQAHGTMTMTNVIEKSLNTGAAFAEARTGNDVFSSYVKKFGFGEKTGIDLQGELKGNIKSLFKADSPQIAFTTASFGQGVAVSTIELAGAFSAIANGGTLYRPYLDSALSPQAVRSVISNSTARQVTGMMVSALEKAEVAKINGYSIAGKTGTAQVADLTYGGYYPDRVIDTYAGFGPTSDPRFVIIIKLTEPEGAPLAGTTVVPVFRDLAQFIINYYNIPPDKLSQ
ncbi:MAG: penicillin-binding protein 2 [Candidatus Liptonbacteria bacterium]